MDHDKIKAQIKKSLIVPPGQIAIVGIEGYLNGTEKPLVFVNMTHRYNAVSEYSSRRLGFCPYIVIDNFPGEGTLMYVCHEFYQEEDYETGEVLCYREPDKRKYLSDTEMKEAILDEFLSLIEMVRPKKAD